jgi:hypothetical protein
MWMIVCCSNQSDQSISFIIAESARPSILNQVCFDDVVIERWLLESQSGKTKNFKTVVLFSLRLLFAVSQPSMQH